MKIGIIKETKTPIDNRVALTPVQVAELKLRYPNHQFFVETSDVRAYTDEEYLNLGVDVVDDLSDCDILFGIKEANIKTIVPNKHYFFFGHIAKMQEYNRSLLKAMIDRNLTFSDYEYLVDDSNKRVCAFGWWAGVVGVYYTLRGYGLRTGDFYLPQPDIDFTFDKLLKNLRSVKLPAVKLLVTGNGRVSQGAQYILNAINALKLDEEEYLNSERVSYFSYAVAKLESLVCRIDGCPFDKSDFMANPQKYKSNFMHWAKSTDILITAHFWRAEDPIYLSNIDLRNPDMKIKIIGDVTCDIMGSIKSTLRSSTHAKPYYDYNPFTEKEEYPFSKSSNITMMAVDTCPNALPRDTSKYFGEMLIEHVVKPLLDGIECPVVRRSTIIDKGCLTERFLYLKDFVLESY